MIRAALLAGVAAALIGAAPASDVIVISGGTIYDGASTTPVVGDVVIQGDKLVAIGPGAGKAYKGARVIDAKGMVVAPGFIDPHTHSDSLVLGATPEARLVTPWLTQGVTTVFTGSDGYGQGKKMPADTFDHVAQMPTGPNVTAYVGFGGIREQVIGETDRAPNADELAKMQQLTATGMCQGALGLSTGLFYAPQSFAKTDEVIAVAREAAKRGGVYDTHQRDESSYTIGLMNSVREVIEIGRQAGLPVHFAHLKALGADVHNTSPEMIAIIEAARKAGVNVTADQYPYEASGSSLIASLVPRWAQDGGAAPLVQRLNTPDTRAKIVAEMKTNLVRRGGANAVLLRDAGKPWAGKRLDAVATEWKVDAIEAAVRIILEDKGEGTSIVSFNMIEPDIERIMKQPWVMTGSDGSAGHPRMWGTFPEKYAKYVVQRKTMSIADFVNSSTGRTADFFKLDKRGHLKTGYYADVVVFDPMTYAPRATYLEPTLQSVGVRTVVVNGRVAIDDGKLTGVAAGRPLKHVPPAGSCPTA